MMTKQVIIMRKDLNMRKGKIAAQAGHASTAVLLKLMRGGKEFFELTDEEHQATSLTLDLADPEVGHWINSNFRKICVSVDSEQELIDAYQLALDAGLNCAMIIDSGFTEFNGVPTKTCIAIGPNEASKIDVITGAMKLF